jgi:hypothetical protein
MTGDYVPYTPATAERGKDKRKASEKKLTKMHKNTKWQSNEKVDK